ncbi:MAG: aminoglycoside phosphotransferase family protein [Rhodospirillales bacterium]|nr:MAG: aminoglycoside phosphotransferase family protein [Rhodospirillales bacterium]
MTPEDLDALHAALITRPGFEGVKRDALAPMPQKGLAHDHIAIRGTGALLRVPRQSQFGLPARENLAYQIAGFTRAAAGGHAPRLHGAIEPSQSVPMGAVIVDHIEGRAAALPRDLPAIADCLASIHRLPLPGPSDRAPLAWHDDPIAGTLAFIEDQAPYLEAATGDAAARRMIEEEIVWARSFAADSAGRDQPITLVATDTHPGNYVIDRRGRAFIVDLEKALYGAPAIDLAHASLYTSTTWDIESGVEIAAADVADFYRHYLGAIPPALAHALEPWLMPLRRLTWLRSTTWSAKWRVESKKGKLKAKHAAAATEDWSAENRDAALIAHVEARTGDYLSAATVERIRAEWREPGGLASLLPG